MEKKIKRLYKNVSPICLIRGGQRSHSSTSWSYAVGRCQSLNKATWSTNPTHRGGGLGLCSDTHYTCPGRCRCDKWSKGYRVLYWKIYIYIYFKKFQSFWNHSCLPKKKKKNINEAISKGTALLPRRLIHIPSTRGPLSLSRVYCIFKVERTSLRF